MAKLPFVVAPKIQSKLVNLGDENVGVVEIEKRGYLSVAEKSFVDSVMQNSDSISGIVRLASEVGRKRKITTEKAYLLLISAIDGTGTGAAVNAIHNDYGQELAVIQAQMAESVQRKAIAATTVLIQTRINPEWDIEDTMTLQPELLAEFSRFYDSEEQKIDFVSESKKDAIDEAADIVGK